MSDELKKDFDTAKTPKPKSNLGVYMVIFKQTPVPNTKENPAYYALLAEQAVYTRAVEELQKKSGPAFPHLVLAEEGVLGAGPLVVCTSGVAEQLKSQPGVAVVVPRPDIPRSLFTKRTEKTITIGPV